MKETVTRPQITADDFGLHRDINRAILDCAREGLINAISIAPCGGALDDVAFAGLRAAAIANPDLRLGVHLQLTEGRTCAGPSTIAKDGELLPYVTAVIPRLYSGRMRLRDVEREWDAQVRLVRGAGVDIRFISSHQHVHLLPGLWRITRGLSQRYQIPEIRTPYESVIGAVLSGSVFVAAFQGLAYLHRLRFGAIRKYSLGMLCSMHFSVAAVLERLVRHLHRSRTIEIMVHPAHTTDSLKRKFPTWNAAWEKEIAELVLLKRVLDARHANPDLHAQTMRRFSGIPAFERWFIEGRSQLCPFWLIDALTPRDGGIFDCGSGHGYAACYCALSSAQRRITGADPDAAKTAMARLAAEGLPAEFHACAAEELLTRDERMYDGAMVIDMLYQLLREQQESLVRQLAARIRPGGVAVIKETHRHAGLRYAFAYAEECLVVSLRRRRPAMRFYYRSVKEWRALMERNGFTSSAVLPVPDEAVNNRSFVMAFVKAASPR